MKRSRIGIALGAFALAILGAVAVKADKRFTAYTGAVYTCGSAHTVVFNCSENTAIVQLTTTHGVNTRATFDGQNLCTISGTALYL